MRTHNVEPNLVEDLDYSYNGMFDCKQCGCVYMGRHCNNEPAAVKIGGRPAHERFARRATKEYMQAIAMGSRGAPAQRDIPLSPGSPALPDEEYEVAK